jgi:hypothetical protein
MVVFNCFTCCMFLIGGLHVSRRAGADRSLGSYLLYFRLCYFLVLSVAQCLLDVPKLHHMQLALLLCLFVHPFLFVWFNDARPHRRGYRLRC